MKQINRIENVWTFKPEPQNGNFWIITMDKKLRGFSPENKLLFSEDRYKIYDLDIFPAGIVCTTGVDPEQTFFVRNGQLELSEYALFLSGKHDGDKFYCFSRYKEQLGYSKLDKKTFTVEAFWPKPFAPDGIRFVTGDRFVSVKRAFITLNSLSDGAELARYEPTSLLDTAKASPYGKLISHKGLLYFYISNDSKSGGATFCVDETTGKIVNRWDNFGGDMFLLGDLIYNAYLHTLEVLDTTTGIIEKMNLEEELGPQGLRIRFVNSVYTSDGKLYFVDGHAAPSNRMGIIDLATQRLLWHTEVAVNDGINNAIDRILVSDDKLYALATDRVLHIFQKE